ncbi:MAG: arginine--tRNA ligase [Desulfovibrio sp.]|uniref:arginine--tRNA ligase n=1 Tax=Desulfovibrio sp. TaxID=885 RepID=UPI00258D1780|nr:arginine--tRNA ligase [Desulfovibrio sp.]MCD7985374.1 arginine--tRNA ligase [Desulfovibrio sp.]
MRATETLRTALAAILEEEGLAWPAKTVIEPSRDPRHGDLSTNAAMLLAKEAKCNPRELARKFADRLLERCPDMEKAEAAGPGFCNVTFSQAFWRRTVLDVEAAAGAYGSSEAGAGRKVLLEYVSANPTGPLHVGHGRGAAVGDSLARLLRKAGYAVDTEYYINDAGRQMRLLGLSVWLRVLELAGRPVSWPEDYYRGEYIIDIAREMLDADPHLPDLPEAEGQERCYQRAMNEILTGIKADLNEFRVEHQRWFSEKTLVESGAVDAAFNALGRSGYTYEKENAFWFATEQLGDDKDRVLKKSDGSLTYFATDIAYHHDKFERGYDWLIDIWGADHHGYVPRMRAAITAMGRPRDSFDVVLIQLVNLLRDGKPVSMSTRAGTFETLADVLREVGVDAARFMFLSRKSDSPLDFDLELAKQRSLDNPVYYVQYAHARICAVLRRAAERGVSLPDTVSEEMLTGLDTPEDMALLRKAAAFEDMLAAAAQALAAHHVSHYLSELAGLLHSYYAKHQVLLADDMPRTLARLALLRAVAQVLRNGLDVLGVSAPESM